MARTLTAPEIAALGDDVTGHAAHARSYLRLEITDADGVYTDLTHVLHGFRYGTDVDQTVIGGSFQIARSHPDYPNGLSPLVTDQIDAGRRLRLYFTTLLHAAGAPASGDLRFVLDAEIDVVDAGSELIDLVVRDWIGARLADTELTREIMLFSQPDGRSWESVIEFILTQAASQIGLGVLDPIVPFDPDATGITVLEYDASKPFNRQQSITVKPQKLLEVIREAAGRVGWQLRPRWNEDDDEFQLAFYPPPQDDDEPDWYIPHDRYIVIPTLKRDRTHVRNAVIVRYVDEDGNAAVYPASGEALTDDASIAAFGYRFAEFAETEESPIRTEADAAAFAALFLGDSAWPVVDLEVEVLMLWPVDLDDVIELEANDEQFTSNQVLAVVGYQHEFGPTRERTRLTLRGKPTGGITKWIRRPRALPGLPWLRITSTEDNETGRTFFFDRACDAIYVYARTVPANSGRINFDEYDLVDILTTEAQYAVTFPAAGEETHVMFEPHGVDSEEVGEGVLFVVRGPTIAPELQEVSHAESGSTGTHTVRVLDPSGVATALRVATKSGADAMSAFSVKDASPDHQDEYEQTVTLVEAHQSFVFWELEYVLNGQTLKLHLLSAGMDRGVIPNITVLDYFFSGDRLWVLMGGDSDTRTSDVTIIGEAAEVIDTEIQLSPIPNYSFNLKHTRGPAWKNTGLDFPQRVGTYSGTIAVRAIGNGGVEGPIVTMPFEREGTGGGGGGDVTIDSFTVTQGQDGTSCSDNAEVGIAYSVTMPGGHTIDVERHRVTGGVDSLDELVVDGETTATDSVTDILPIWATGEMTELEPDADYKYKIVVRDGSDDIVASEWWNDGEIVRFYGVTECGP